MKKIQYLTGVCLLAGAIAACGQTPAKPKTAPAAVAVAGDAAKGKVTFDEQCGLCHDALTTDRKMGPGLKGLFKMAKLGTNGKPVTDANVLERINTGGNGMPPYQEMISEGEKANLLAYLKKI